MTVDPNIPTPEFSNLFLEDPLAGEFAALWLGDSSYEAVRGHLVDMGERAARATPLSARADKHSPALQTHDRAGRRIDRIEYHPDYERLEELAYGGGIVALKYEPRFLDVHRRNRHLVGFLMGYSFAQTEPGLYCPVCMTDGVGRVLERHGVGDVARETIAHLASRSRAELWQGAMFLTEKQGGSDVGANAVEAVRDGDAWRLHGDKWFCSNVDAEAILTLARMPDGAPGTRGLGLFLVLRHRPEGNGRSIRIHRLKDKLGVRSMPSGEVTFEGTVAHLIGGEGRGFKQMAEMLNLSRMYNAVASVGGMRRAILEAAAYGSKRRAFGRTLVELPLWRATMADLQAEFLGSFALTFEAVRALDRADNGDAQAARLVRLVTPMAKALTGKTCIFAVSEAMEAIGGNAYIEESILPRLLRDCQVLPIWEGTTNILTLDVMRAIRKEACHEALFARLDEALSAPPVQARSRVDQIRARASASLRELQRLATLDDEGQQRGARAWLEQAGRWLGVASLIEASGRDALRDVCLAAVDRMLARPFAVSPVASSGAVDLAGTEEVLLPSIWSRMSLP